MKAQQAASESQQASLEREKTKSPDPSSGVESGDEVDIDNDDLGFDAPAGSGVEYFVEDEDYCDAALPPSSDPFGSDGELVCFIHSSTKISWY